MSWGPRKRCPTHRTRRTLRQRRPRHLRREPAPTAIRRGREELYALSFVSRFGQYSSKSILYRNTCILYCILLLKTNKKDYKEKICHTEPLHSENVLERKTPNTACHCNPHYFSLAARVQWCPACQKKFFFNIKQNLLFFNEFSSFTMRRLILLMKITGSFRSNLSNQLTLFQQQEDDNLRNHNILMEERNI